MNDEKQLILSIRKEVEVADLKSIPDLRSRLLTLKNIRTQVDSRMNAIIKPLRESIKKTQELFKPILIVLDESDDILRENLLMLEKEREEADKKLAKQVKDGSISVEEALVEVSPQEKGLFRTIKKLKITSKSKIPEKYWIIDEVKLRADLIAGKKVPGAKLTEEKVVVAR